MFRHSCQAGEVIISELFHPTVWLAWQACSEKAAFSFALRCSTVVEINFEELNSLLKDINHDSVSISRQ